ncbi:MFS transporter [Paraburkholderia flava]|uniref:MFS transporter n=1 Tax=Paraburkholderia flava TaxID=2547393 RepID=UPI00105D6573|nr:MFS transporter [Paraburkholderia flava]
MDDALAPPQAPRATPQGGATAGPCDALVIRAQPSDSGKPCVHQRLALIATILGSSMAFIDGSVVNVALSSIQTELGSSVAAMQWVVDAYLLLLGSLVLVGGAAGDRFGRRTVFIAGVALFTLASIACGFAPGSGTLIAARAVQGIGAALLVPGSLAIIGAVFDERDRGRAIGTWAGFGAITGALGPVAGGWLVDVWSWRAIFFLNVPLACATIALAAIAVPDSRNAEAQKSLDWPGALTAATGLGALTYGLTTASAHGFAAPVVFVPIVCGIALLTAFIALERKRADPMMPLDVFRSLDFTGANLVTLLLYFALGGLFFFLPFALIRAHGYSATQAGAALLPVPLAIGLLSRVTGGLTARFGMRALLVAGPAVAGIGFAMFALPGAHGRYWSHYFPALTTLGLGMTITIAPLTTVVMTAVSRERTGIASGINNAVARVASLLAIAVLGIVFVAAHDAALSTHGDGHASASLDAAPSSATAIAPDALQAMAIDHAFAAVALVCAACAFVGAIGAALTIGRKPR